MRKINLTISKICIVIVGVMLLAPLSGKTLADMDLSLAEKFLLLQLDAVSGRYVSSSHEIEMGLAGILLLELEKKGKIAVQDKKIALLDREPTGNILLDQVLEKMIKAKKKKSLYSWVSRIGNHAGKYESMVLGDLIAKGIITKKRKKFLIFLCGNRYPVLQGELCETLRQEWRKIIMINPDALSSYEKELIGILYACDLARILFPQKAELKAVKPQFKMIFKNSRFAKAVDDSISSENVNDTISFITGLLIN